MARIPLLKTRDGLTGQQQEVFDWIVESRGQMLRPYEVLLHTPGLARRAAELGHQIRYEGALTDHDRELAIITVANVHGCRYEWDSHVGLARDADVSEVTIATLETGEGELAAGDEVIVGFVRQLCADANVSDERLAAVEATLGDDALVVELATLVGFYTLLVFAMRIGGAC